MVKILAVIKNIEQNSQLCQYLTQDNNIDLKITSDEVSALKQYYDLKPDIFILDTSFKNIKYIHIRDYNKKTQEYVYFGEGTIPITELLKSLNKDKYDGVISLETMLPKYNKNESKKDIFVKSYKSLMNIYNKEE